MAQGLRNIALTELESKRRMAELIDQVIHRAGHQSVNLEAVTEPMVSALVKQKNFCHLFA